MYIRILRKRWLLIVAMTVLGVAIAAGATVLIPPTYAADSTSYISITSTGTPTSSLVQNSQFVLQRVASYTAVVKSPEVLGPVIQQLKLDLTVKKLASQVSAENPKDTVLITVTANNADAAQAQAIANVTATKLNSVIEGLDTPKKGGSSPVKATVIVPAGLPAAPISPRKALNLALGLFGGFAVGVAAAVLRDQLDASLKDPEDLLRLTGLSPLGTIEEDDTYLRHPLIALEVGSSGVEAFRSIRTNLQFADVDEPARQIVITSAVANEGKTTTACNLAITMAQASVRVCLVEADLRRPRVTTYFGLDGTVGLTNVVAGQHSLDDVLIPWNRGLVSILPAGTTPPDPSQLLGSNAFVDLLRQLRERFDVVLLDAPPLLPVSDAAVLTTHSDGALLVTRYGHTRRDQVAAAADHLTRVNGRLIGTILNRVPPKEHTYRYGHDYGYGYSSAEGPSQQHRRRASDADIEDPVADDYQTAKSS